MESCKNCKKRRHCVDYVYYKEKAELLGIGDNAFYEGIGETCLDYEGKM